MTTMTHTVAGTAVPIHVVRTREDIPAFQAWIDSHAHAIVAVDTETSGLNIYAPGFSVRTVQFGTASVAWVVVVNSHTSAAVTQALATLRKLVMHNAPFDICVLAQTDHAPLEALLDKTYDTYILAHLLDSRTAGEDGAPGLTLKSLAQIYVDPDAADGQAELYAIFRALGRNKGTGWSHPDLPNYEVYLRYAGLDVIYTSRILTELGPMVRARGLSALATREHEVQKATTRMTHRGVRCDLDYTRTLAARLAEEEGHFTTIAQTYGVDNINSVKQVREALLARGIPLHEKTKSGALSVGRDVLLPLAGLTPYWTPIVDAKVDPLAEAVVRAKRASKWRVAYADTFLATADEFSRVHPSIKALAARTARMSISQPALHQVPASDWTIRRCLIADPGSVFISTDFAQVELRVIAANANVPQMKDAIYNGIELHDRTADLIWGAGNWSKKQRGIGKSVAFAKAYGGGADVITKTAGIDITTARAVVKAFDRAYPQIVIHSKRLQRQAAQRGWDIVTPVYGRRLALSRDRSYAALNYEAQSVARDIFADALLRATDEGVTCVLPIHDELITQWPIDAAEEGAAAMQRLMTSRYLDVPIDASSDILWGGSWGSHPDYKIPSHEDYRPDEHAAHHTTEDSQ